MARVLMKKILIGPEKRGKPKRSLGRDAAPSTRSRLREIREEIVASGERLLTLEEVRREVAKRRGTYSGKDGR